MSRNAGKICVFIGVLFLAAALIWLEMNRMEERRGEQIAGERMLEMQAILKSSANAEDGKKNNPAIEAGQVSAKEYPEINTTQISEGQVDVDQPEILEMPTIMMDGVAYIGSICIPDAKIELPVQANWSEKALKETPCRYSGSLYAGDLIIAGHNYARHFSPIKQMKTGASILFTDAEGKEHAFEVIALETIKGRDIQGMLNHDVPWDLTLFTCTYGGSDRFAIRCKMK